MRAGGIFSAPDALGAAEQAPVWAQAGLGATSPVSASIVENCRKTCGISNEEWLLLGGAGAAANIAAAMGTATNPVAAAVTIGALLGVSVGYAGCLVQCAWYTPECFVPTVCKSARAARPDRIPADYVDRYCDYSDQGQGKIDALCNRVYYETTVYQEAGHPDCGVEAEACPCCAGFECIDGACTAPPLPEPLTEAEKEKDSLWSPLLIGGAITAVALVGIYAFGNKRRRPNRNAPIYRAVH